MLSLRLKSYASRFLSVDSNGKSDSVIVPLAIMAVVAAINLFTLVLIAKSVSAEQSSLFAFWFSILSLFAGISVAGQDNLILKNWNNQAQSKTFALARGSCMFGAIGAFTAASVATLAAASLKTVSGGSMDQALSCTAFAVCFTIIYFIIPAVRTNSGFTSGDGNLEIIWWLFTMAAILLATTKGVELSVADTFWILSVGVVLAVGLSKNAILLNMACKRIIGIDPSIASLFRQPHTEPDGRS